MKRPAVTAAATVALLALPSTAAAVPMCADSHPSRDIVGGQETMESIVSDAKGRLVYSSGGSLWRLDKPGAKPKKVATFDKPGGLLAEPDGTIIAGSGDGLQEGLQGNLSPIAKLVRVNTDTGKVTTLYSGLQMSNGVARGPDGTIYASNDLGLSGIDRIRNGKVEIGWGKVFSANGMAVDPFGPYLYANLTFQPAAVARLDTRTGAVSTYVRLGLDDIAAGPDGMTIDQLGRLFVAANLSGQVWRVDRNRTVCAIAKGLTNTSAVAFGSSLGGDGGFPAENLYAVGFDGVLTEIPNARPRPASTVATPAERVVLRVSPTRVRAGRKVIIKIRVTLRSGKTEHAASRARVRFGSRVVKTNSKGRATVVRRFEQPATVKVAVVTQRKPKPAAVTLRVLAKRR